MPKRAVHHPEFSCDSAASKFKQILVFKDFMLHMGVMARCYLTFDEKLKRYILSQTYITSENISSADNATEMLIIPSLNNDSINKYEKFSENTL